MEFSCLLYYYKFQMQFNVFCSSPNNYHTTYFSIIFQSRSTDFKKYIYLLPKTALIQIKVVLHTCNCKSHTHWRTTALTVTGTTTTSSDSWVIWQCLGLFPELRLPTYKFSIFRTCVVTHLFIVCFPEESVTSALVYLVYLIFILSLTTSCWCCQHTWWFIIQSRQASKVSWKGGCKFINTTSDCSDDRGSTILCRLKL